MEEQGIETVIYIKKPFTQTSILSFEDDDGPIEVKTVVENMTDFSLEKLEELIYKHDPALVFIDSTDFEEVYEITVANFKDLGVNVQFSDGTSIPTWGFEPEDY